MDSDENEWLRRDVMNENNISAEKRFSLATMQLPEDLKKLNIEQCQQLCKEIRSVLIQTVSKNGGHLASNLGAVSYTHLTLPTNSLV